MNEGMNCGCLCRDARKNWANGSHRDVGSISLDGRAGGRAFCRIRLFAEKGRRVKYKLSSADLIKISIYFPVAALASRSSLWRICSLQEGENCVIE